MFKNAASIGIIGGADGPTAVFVTSSFSPMGVALAVLAGVVAIGFAVYFTKKRRK